MKGILHVNDTQYQIFKKTSLYFCTFQMDLGLQTYPEHRYDYVKRVHEKEVSDPSITYDDGESTQVPQAGAGRGKKAGKVSEGGHEAENVYETPNVYAEIPNVDYETLQQGTIELPMSALPKSSAPNTRPALPGEPQHQPCCRKSTRFWCLLTVALSTVIVILLIGFLTGMI